METKPTYTRPTFKDALDAWTVLLRQRGLPVQSIWIFDENLCFERDPDKPGGFRLNFQTALTPPPPGAEQIAYRYFREYESPLVFYRIGSNGDKSVCLLLCDDWFDAKGEAEGFSRRDDWGVFFRPGPHEGIEEIKDEQRWRKRIVRDRPLHDLDFCMTLRSVHETLAHGRVLSSYERYALKLLHVWRHLVGAKHG
jgi:hypothetical protein